MAGLLTPVTAAAFAAAAVALVVAGALIRDIQRLRARLGTVSAERDALAAEIERHGNLRERAEAASDAKSRFIATVSHEVRTPLNGVLGMADLLRDTRLDAEQQTYVRAIKSSGEALLSLIDEILDFSRVEAGKLEIVEESVDLRPLVEGVVELLAPRAQGKGIEIAVRVAPEVPRTILSDGARLRQIVMNLAGNAVKFTEAGGVGITLTRPRPDCLRLTVEDTGPGIPQERLGAIFAEFEQADGSAARRHGGAGLGLAISRRLAEALGGDLSVTSRLGHGSAFRLDLPVDVAAAAPRSLSVPALAGAEVTIVSDGPFAAAYLARTLADLGLRAQVLSGAAAAIEAPARAPALLIIDAALGAESTRRLAQYPARARIVLLSPFERRTFGSPAEAGFDGYLVKPIRERSLAVRLKEWASESRPGPAAPNDAPARPAPAPVLSGHRILIAEDNEINALLTRRLIEKLGGSCLMARDGAEALDLLRAERGSSRLSLALLDIQMPGIDGLEATRRWRRHEADLMLPRLPLVALTANVYREDRQAALAAGFDGFLPKPLEREALIALICETVQTRPAA